MKNLSYICHIVLFAALGAFLVGCNPSGDPADTTSAEAIDKQLAEVQSTADDAASDLSAFTYAQKQEYVATMEAQLAEMKSSIDELAASIAKSSVAVRTEAEPKLAALRARQERLENQLDVIKGADSSTWERVKRSTTNAYDDLKTGFNDMRQWLSEKVAP